MNRRPRSPSSDPGVRRRAGRPAKPLLSRGLIADAALDIVTADGIDGLTMKTLAGRLGVSVSSLYNHIANKAELLASVQDAVMSRVDAQGFTDVGAAAPEERAVRLAEALRHWSRSYRQVFADYPSLVPLIATMPVTGAPETRRMYDTVAAGLLAAGVPSARVVPVIVAFESFLYGSAMDAHAPAGIFSSAPEESDAPTFRAVVEAFTAGGETEAFTAGGETEAFTAGGETEAFTAGAGGGDDAVPPRSGVPNPYADLPFEWGLDALVARTLTLLG
ncbi:Tetracycline repressor protein class A [Corynebacterium provencense]|uniref:Tetracycline repressor protein class A n=1 Tax=Corynebacterium provencense TaxID=1737425 RepID=A0A2Z3YSV4_9CORY|nr:TetR/AcrR family transcriptional regulator [Corynebacterium provencense]AWT27369.1 Tetracycline repressor protein class A [Corynebacterium provencense]